MHFFDLENLGDVRGEILYYKKTKDNNEMLRQKREMVNRITMFHGRRTAIFIFPSTSTNKTGFIF